MRNLIAVASLSRLLIVVLGLVGCGSDALKAGAGDLAGFDLAGADLAGVDHASALDFSATDLSLRLCISQQCTGGVPCANGPHAGCCNPGEWCDRDTCRCGFAGACKVNQMCASAGASSLDGCGTICCGGGSPCPL